MSRLLSGGGGGPHAPQRVEPFLRCFLPAPLPGAPGGWARLPAPDDGGEAGAAGPAGGG